MVVTKYVIFFQPHYKLIPDEKEFEETAFKKKLSGKGF